jgi:hypothetical protein
MTAATLQQVFLALMSVGFLFALFGKAAGLPEWSETAGALFGGLCAVTALILQRRAKKRGELPVSSTPDQRLRKRWLFIPLIAIVTLSSPLWLPFTGVTLPLSQLILSSLGSCVCCIGIVLFATRETRPRA